MDSYVLLNLTDVNNINILLQNVNSISIQKMLLQLRINNFVYFLFIASRLIDSSELKNIYFFTYILT